MRAVRGRLPGADELQVAQEGVGEGRIAREQFLRHFGEARGPVLFWALLQSVEFAVQREDGLGQSWKQICGDGRTEAGERREVMEVRGGGAAVGDLQQQFAGQPGVVRFEHGEQTDDFGVEVGVG